MKAQLERRLAQLREELESGEKMLADLDVRRSNLRDSILRISGAIQVLQEELAALDGRTDGGENASEPDQK